MSLENSLKIQITKPVTLQESSIDDVLHRLKEKIWHKRPILGEIMQRHSEKSVYDYTKDFLDVNSVSPHIERRREELIGVAEELIGKRLGTAVGSAVAQQLRARALVSTIDHHGPLTHPFFLNANIIASIPLLESGHIEDTYLVVFSFASVSLNNASAFPRGFYVHSKHDGSGEMVRIPILPDKLKMSIAYSVSAFTHEDVGRAYAEIDKRKKAGILDSERASQIANVVRTYYEHPDVLDAPDFVTQISRLNFRLWRDMFHFSGEGVQRSPSPHLVYLDIETLVTELLLKFHLFDSSSLMHRLLFDAELKNHVLQNFDELEGAFSTNTDKGTYLFWGVDEKKHRVRLKLDNGYLISEDRLIRIGLTPEEIADALRTKAIFPSMLLGYIMVSLYYGMKCLGGFCQVHDLTMIKMAWQSILHAIGQQDEAEAISPIQTKELGGDGMVLAYLGNRQEGLAVPATGIDMILDTRETHLEKYASLSQKLQMQEVMSVLLPEIYTVLYPSYEREELFMSLTPEHIFRSIGLFDKINGFSS